MVSLSEVLHSHNFRFFFLAYIALFKDKAVKAEHEKLLPGYELAKGIIQQRLKKKMTQSDVAKKTGMPQPTIARIEGLTRGLPDVGQGESFCPTYRPQTEP